jgi:hypothetical protein
VELQPAEPAGVGVAPGQGVEDGRLAGSGKPDDRDLHGSSLSPTRATFDAEHVSDRAH